MRTALATFLIFASHVMFGQIDSTGIMILKVQPVQQQEHHAGRKPIWIINGVIDSVGGLNLINLHNIENIEVVKSAKPPEIRVTTKTGIVFVDYQYLKDRLHTSIDDNPGLIVDEVKYRNELMFAIDRSCIKKLKLIRKDSVDFISITTISFKKQKKRKRPEIYIRGAASALWGVPFVPDHRNYG